MDTNGDDVIKIEIKMQQYKGNNVAQSHCGNKVMTSHHMGRGPSLMASACSHLMTFIIH
jgi:hypothetical protein